MERIFVALGGAVTGSATMALIAAFAWGVLSVALSPCHLSGIPLIVGYLSGGELPRFRRGLALSSVFAAGVLVTIAAIGAVTAALGRIAGDVGAQGNYLLAGVFIAMGLALMDLVRLPWSASVPLSSRQRGYGGALTLGLVFGVGLGPCTFAFIAPVLAAALGGAAAHPVRSASLLLAYGLGHSVVLALAGASAAVVQQWTTSRRVGRGTTAVKRACGALVVCAGIYLAWTH